VALSNLKKKFDDLHLRYQTYLAKMQDPKELIMHAINLPFNDASNLKATQFFDGLLPSKILKPAKQYFKEEVFTPWKILCCMDINCGKILLEPIDLLHRIKTDGKKYISNTILLSSLTIEQVAKLVKEFVNQIGVLYTIKRCPENIGSGEVISFPRIPVIKLVLKATTLFDEAKKRPITTPQSCDGTQMSKNLGVIIYGIKIADQAVVCLLSKQPVWL
jgi:hypothetical protein